MVLQIFNEALQYVIYRVMVGACWLQEAAAPGARMPRDSQGVRFLLQDGREETTEMYEKSGTCKIKTYRVISKTRSFGQWNEGFAFYLMKE